MWVKSVLFVWTWCAFKRIWGKHAFLQFWFLSNLWCWWLWFFPSYWICRETKLFLLMCFVATEEVLLIFRKYFVFRMLFVAQELIYCFDPSRFDPEIKALLLSADVSEREFLRNFWTPLFRNWPYHVKRIVALKKTLLFDTWVMTSLLLRFQFKSSQYRQLGEVDIALHLLHWACLVLNARWKNSLASTLFAHSALPHSMEFPGGRAEGPRMSYSRGLQCGNSAQRSRAGSRLLRFGPIFFSS